MSTIIHTSKLGLNRGWIEFKQFLHTPQELIWTFIITIVFVGVLWFQRGTTIEGVSLAILTLPSLLGMIVANGGFVGAAGILSYDREDGTLLRAKATPQGMGGYLIARVMYVIYTTLFSLIVLFIPSAIIIGASVIQNVSLMDGIWFMFILLLGLLATAPWGAIVGSLVKSSSSGFGLTFLPMAGLVAISGIFYPISAIAGWLQIIAQIFPVYWLGLGVRSVFLPENAVAMEIGGSWRPIETVVVVSAWAIIGMIIAPRILRKMAKRESGSAMESRKERTLSRGY